jgi:hypothetical protein
MTKFFWAIPIIAAIMIGGVYSTASASGPSCPEAGVIHALFNSKNAFAFYDNTISRVSFSYGMNNCTPDNGPPQKFGFAFVSLDSLNCFTSVEITKDNFEWGFEYTTLTLDDTACGDIFVEWWGDGTTQDTSFKSSSGENCHDGKQFFISNGKFQFATSTISVDGAEFDTTVDPTDANISRGNFIQTVCETGTD